ncbi:MAG: trigger factor [Chromatiaceae bacterium]|jgi:trigger factor|nr:trigger factor [Chromatiaceae bacterium]
MQVSVESGEGLERRMKVGLEHEPIDAEVEKRLRELARSASMPGFRPGKVPVKILRQRYGGQVRQEVFGEMVQSSFSEAVAQEELRPAAMPQIEADIDASAKRYSYTAVFEVLPQFELGGLEGKTLKRPVAEVTDSDLERMLERLREQRKTWKAVERPAQSGDRLRISFTGTLDGEPFEGGSAENTSVELGLGRMIPGFEEGLVGMRTGDERRLELKFPDAYPAEHLKGKPVAFDVRVGDVAEPMIPDLDADFAQAFGFPDGDLDGFRVDVRKNMERELKERIDARVKNRAMDLLLEMNQIQLPDALIKQEIGALKEQTRKSAGGGNFELPDDLFIPQAKRRVALGLIIAEVVKANGIEVDPERVRAAVEDMASTYEHPQHVINYYYSNKEHLASVETLTLENQVVDWVLDQVTVEDDPTTFAALSEPAVTR